MKNTIRLNFLSIAAVLITLTGCHELIIEKDIASSPTSTFEYLWKEVNNKYAYLDYKKVNWNLIHDEYKAKINDEMSQEELFNILASMLNELKDGHVNLISPFNTSNYYPVFLNSPKNYNDRLILESYLLRNAANYFKTGSLRNTILDTNGVKLGYIRYNSFSENIKDQEIDYVIKRFQNMDGIILDLRSNGGGSIANLFKLTSRFVNKETLVYQSFLKSGSGKNDYEKVDVIVKPEGPLQFTKRLAVLTNRECFSATSFFALGMQALPNTKLIGDTTGGGLGIPNGGELPNGWTYRFSVSKTLSIIKDSFGQPYNWENGVPPNISVGLDKSLEQKGYDSIVETAILYIKNGN